MNDWCYILFKYENLTLHALVWSSEDYAKIASRIDYKLGCLKLARLMLF